MLNVALGKTSAGATWPQAWRSFQSEQPELASQLQVLWETPALVNNAVIVHGHVDPASAARLRDALVRLGDDEAGQHLLRLMGLRGFEPADARTYEPVRDFLGRFEAEVRPLAPS